MGKVWNGNIGRGNSKPKSAGLKGLRIRGVGKLRGVFYYWSIKGRIEETTHDLGAMGAT